MNKKSQAQNLEKRITLLKSRLTKLGEMRPGSLSQQYNVCRSPGCKCKDPKDPKPHGPYYQVSYTRHGKSTSQAVPATQVDNVKKQLATYKTFRMLIDDWIELALQHAKLKLELNKQKTQQN